MPCRPGGHSARDNPPLSEMRAGVAAAAAGVIAICDDCYISAEMTALRALESGWPPGAEKPAGPRATRPKTSAAALWKPSGSTGAAIDPAISSISATQRQPLAAADAAARSDC